MAYFSRKIIPAKTRYKIYNDELLAMLLRPGNTI